MQPNKSRPMVPLRMPLAAVECREIAVCIRAPAQIGARNEFLAPEMEGHSHHDAALALRSVVSVDFVKSGAGGAAGICLGPRQSGRHGPDRTTSIGISRDAIENPAFARFGQKDSAGETGPAGILRKALSHYRL